MVTKEEEMKAEEELLNSSATENGAENGTEKNGTAAVAAPVVEKDPMEEEHTTEFEEYPEEFFKNLVALKKDKAFNDGSLVFVSDGKRKRFPVLMSSIAIGSIKLNREYLKAKRTMMEAGYMNNTIDLMLPDFSQPDQSTPETAVRSIVNYIYTGKLDVSDASIKNITVLSSFLGLEPILAKIPDAATELGLEDFPLEELTTKGKGLGEMKVVGLDKFISAGFGNKPRSGDKRRSSGKGGKFNPGGNGPEKKKPKETPAEEKKEATDGAEAATEIKQTDEPMAAATPVEPAPVEETPAEVAPVEAAPVVTAEETPTVEPSTDGDVGPTVEDTETATAVDPTPEPTEPAAVVEEATPEPVPEPVQNGTGRGKGRRGRGRGRRGRGRGK